MKTRIGNSRVPVVKADFYTIVRFCSGAHGKQERGDYAFWTAVYKRKRGDRSAVIARARVGNDPGERFRRIGKERRTAPTPLDRAEYKIEWSRMGGGANVKHIRPSTHYEVLRWMAGHVTDAVHVLHTNCGGL